MCEPASRIRSRSQEPILRATVFFFFFSFFCFLFWVFNLAIKSYSVLKCYTSLQKPSFRFSFVRVKFRASSFSVCLCCIQCCIKVNFIEQILKVNSWFQILMIFGFPSARKFSYVRRSFGNGGSLRDDPKNSCEGDYRNGRFVSVVLSPWKPGSYFFLNSSPLNSKDWTTAYFEQFKSLGIKHVRPPRWKSAQFTWLKKKKNHNSTQTDEDEQSTLTHLLDKILFNFSSSVTTSPIFSCNFCVLSIKPFHYHSCFPLQCLRNSWSKLVNLPNVTLSRHSIYLACSYSTKIYLTIQKHASFIELKIKIGHSPWPDLLCYSLSTHEDRRCLPVMPMQRFLKFRSVSSDQHICRVFGIPSGVGQVISVNQNLLPVSFLTNQFIIAVLFSSLILGIR